MIVRCANCQTEFSLDESQVGPEGFAVRCSVCGYVFRASSNATANPKASWQVRTIDGLLFTAPDLPTLREWIAEGRLHPDDEVSRTGKRWLRLGDMPELAEAFVGFPALNRVVTAVGAAEPTPVKDDTALGPPPAFGTAPKTESRPGNRTMRWQGGVMPSSRPATGDPDARHTDRQRGAERPVRVPEQPRVVAEQRMGGLRVLDGGAARSAAAPDLDLHSEPSPVVAEERSDSSWNGFDGPEPAPADTFNSSSNIEVVARRRRPWLWVGIGLLAIGGAAAVPDVRHRVFGTTSQASVDLPELAQVRAAVQTADPNAIGLVEAGLVAKIDSGTLDARGVANLKLAQAELLAIQALVSNILLRSAGDSLPTDALDPDLHAQRAAVILDAVRVDEIADRDRLRRTRALVHLAEGRAVTEVETLLADVPADHLRTLIQSAPVWRTPTAVVSDETIERLTTASVDAPLAALVLTLAHINRGEHERARETISRLLAKVPTHAAALAMSAALDKTGQSGAMPAVPKPGAKVGTPAGDVVGQTPADEAGGTDRTVDAASRGSEKSDKGLSVERLIDRGCEEVESGNATQGINLLRKAQEKRPKDVDVLVCLGEGHKRLGTHSKALNFFESALAVSPRYGAALRGAARAAKASGDKKKALDYYQRVLEQEPRNAEARQYVKENG